MAVIRPLTEEYQSYLFDESRTMGRADWISFPRTEQEIVEAVLFAQENHLPVTAQGALTGLAGGASPAGGLVLNLSRMNRALGLRREGGAYFLRAQPGLVLKELRKMLSEKKFDLAGWSEESVETLREIRPGQLFFSPDPTEPAASIGGMASCNACGARSFLYGSTRRHVHAIRVVLADGRVAELVRGRDRARGREFSLPLLGGGMLSGRLPHFDSPNLKDAGYYFRENMDLVDLFLGSQGTLGVLSELELKLMDAPKYLWGATAFLPGNEAALQYVSRLKSPAFPYRPAAIEFFDQNALAMVERQKAETPAFRQLQPLPEDYRCAVYAEFNSNEREDFYPSLQALGALVESLGGDPAKSWVARDRLELEKLLLFRHSVPETIDLIVEKNKKNAPEITILSTDMAVSDDHFPELFRLYERDLEESGLPWVIFGHIGENHVHPNILARDSEEYKRGHRLFEKWAADVKRLGGSITAEHGAGKIKRKLFWILLGEEKMLELLRFKRQFDPEGLLGPGNILTEVGE